MTVAFSAEAVNNFEVDNNKSAFQNLFDQYEYVIVNSLVTSFGLDFLVTDHYGGDVDTIHNVREIGIDPNMKYKDSANAAAYTKRGEYISDTYHSDSRYVNINRKVSNEKKLGNLIDEYTGKRIAPNETHNLDHVISAKDIHDDRGRVLSGLRGEDLANRRENLKPTNPHTNKTKSAKDMDIFIDGLEYRSGKYIDKYGYEYTPEAIERMKRLKLKSKQPYDYLINKSYYLSPIFAKSVTKAACNVGLKMGLRQALGLLMAELWFSIKDQFQRLKSKFNDSHSFGEYLTAIKEGLKRWLIKIQDKRKELIGRFKEGALAGILTSITTTLINVFATTAKNTIKIIRQIYAHLVEAAKILFFNPNNLEYGDCLKAVMKIIAVGASVVLGTMVSEAISKTPINAIPELSDVVPTFCGTLVTGIISCTLLYFFDRSTIITKLVTYLNGLTPYSEDIKYFKEQTIAYEKYASELASIDYEHLKMQTENLELIAEKLENAENEDTLNEALLDIYMSFGWNTPWGEGSLEEAIKVKRKIVHSLN